MIRRTCSEVETEVYCIEKPNDDNLRKLAYITFRVFVRQKLGTHQNLHKLSILTVVRNIPTKLGSRD